MRLDREQRDAIVNTIRQLDPDAGIHLFGSRTDDSAKGGDIDIIVLSSVLSYREKLLIRARLKEKIGNRKIDLIITETPRTAFEKYAYKTSVPLSD
ncbi:MAG: nucleotidyltransferase domain-containing protein [Marinilabiliales bacterium]|nr:MAG: nucleotidyltransferase domain-containing protein [Marinilabiliales bacterium]